jgi:formimidoylglutamase
MNRDPEKAFTESREWWGPSSDPNDEQFGDVIEPATLHAADDVGAVLVGEPYGGAVIGRGGAEEGPTALRDALAATKTHHFDAGPVGPVADLGDVATLVESDVEGTRVEVVQMAVKEAADLVYAVDAVPVFLGGDNSLTYANAAPLLDWGRLGAISFDAHLDCREVHDEPTSGTPYRQLHREGLDALAVVGARHFETSTAYADYAVDQGATIVTADEVALDTMTVADRVRDAMAGVDAIYVSLDLDVLDGAAAPGVSAPTPGGISTRELFRLVRLFAADERVAGFEVVECAPPLDSGDRTARAGARAVAHFLSAHQSGADLEVSNG